MHRLGAPLAPLVVLLHLHGMVTSATLESLNPLHYDYRSSPLFAKCHWRKNLSHFTEIGGVVSPPCGLGNGSALSGLGLAQVVGLSLSLRYLVLEGETFQRIKPPFGVVTGC